MSPRSRQPPLRRTTAARASSPTDARRGDPKSSVFTPRILGDSRLFFFANRRIPPENVTFFRIGPRKRLRFLSETVSNVEPGRRFVRETALPAPSLGEADASGRREDAAHRRTAPQKGVAFQRRGWT